MKIAIAFIVHDRPEYFRQVLDCAKQQTLLFSNYDVYLFQDNSDKKDKVQESIELFNKYFPSGVIHEFKNNVGVALNYHFASQYLMVDRDYTHIIFVEEDLIFAPHYLETMVMLIEKFNDDQRIGMIGVSGANRMNTLDVQVQHCNELISMTNTWNFCLPKHAFLKIEPIVSEYLNKFIIGKDYRRRNHIEIRHWLKEKGFKGDVTSQDHIKTCALAKNNLIKITCYPGLVKHIGVVGLHNNEIAYKKYRFGEQVLYEGKIEKIEELTEEKYNQMLIFSNKTYLY